MKKIATEKVLNVYNLINEAKISKMDDADKFKMIKIARALKPVATSFEDFKKDAGEKLKGENHDKMVEKAQQWQEAAKENELDFEPLGEEAFGKLVASNDWTLGQITAIEEVI